MNLISKEGEHKANLNSLVQSRNDFAHGVNLSSIKMETVIKNYESGIYIESFRLHIK
ncbi:HEPN domain-containing protein [Enterococcus mundtii]|uniref:HEPN domain-containing protein n=1 Tax=Enterococcus mundtii TaxID=53346 RepID=UPI0035C00422